MSELFLRNPILIHSLIELQFVSFRSECLMKRIVNITMMYYFQLRWLMKIRLSLIISSSLMDSFFSNYRNRKLIVCSCLIPILHSYFDYLTLEIFFTSSYPIIRRSFFNFRMTWNRYSLLILRFKRRGLKCKYILQKTSTANTQWANWNQHLHDVIFYYSKR